MDVDLQSPRAWQAVAAGVVLLGFVADFRFVAVAAVLGLLGTFVRIDRSQRVTWATEIGLLLLATVLFIPGRAGWAWVLVMVAAGVAALAAMADVWVLPRRA